MEGSFLGGCIGAEGVLDGSTKPPGGEKQRFMRLWWTMNSLLVSILQIL